MTKCSTILRQCVIPRQCRRDISSTTPPRASTSPQQRSIQPLAVTSSLKRFADIPGPLALPMLRHSAHVLPRIGSYHHTVGLGLLEGLRNRYGDLVRLAKASRTRPVLYVFNPETMREIYESRLTDIPRWERSPVCQHRKQMGSGCPMHGGETQAVRAAIRALLQDNTLLKNFEKTFDDIATDFTSRLETLRHEANALNEELETELYRWALETLGVTIFGLRLGCLDGAPNTCTKNRLPERTSMDDDIPNHCSLSRRKFEELTLVEQLIKSSKEIADGRYLVRSEQTLKTESETFKSSLKVIDRHFSLTEQFLCKALDALDKDDVRPEQVLLGKLRSLDKRILPLAADLLLAGVEPLVHTAIAMFHQLSFHPAQQQRAHDEVSWSTASIKAGSTSSEMPYISACVSEALRIHPVTGGVVRRSREVMEVAGYEVPAGVDIVLAHGVTSKEEKQWGRAKAFIPERWCHVGWQPTRLSRAHPLASTPFGEDCPATGVVGKMLGSLNKRVLEQYRIEWHGAAPNMMTAGVNKLQPPFYFVLQNAA